MLETNIESLETALYIKENFDFDPFFLTLKKSSLPKHSVYIKKNVENKIKIVFWCILWPQGF